MMLRLVAAVIATLAFTPTAPAGARDALPRPPELEDAVRFWIRIYGEVDGKSGLIHDSEHLGVVYEVFDLSPGLSGRAQERRIEAVKRSYRDSLRRLAQGVRSGLSKQEERVLSRWPKGTANQTLRDASRNLRFQLGQADKFRAGVVRSGRWAIFIERVLREHDVPTDLSALPQVESSYDPRAYSRVGAAGMWQFTRSTGRRYLRVDHVVDERLDPFDATVAAARLLRDNYRRLQSWPLAITAYNHGVSGMARAVRKLGTDDIAEIVRRYRSRTFGFASRNFYAEFLAAREVQQNAKRYFGSLKRDRPIDYATVELAHYYPAKSLERALGIDREILREHNLALRPAVWNGSKHVPRGYTLRVPPDALKLELAHALESIPRSERLAQQHRDRFYKVRRGDSLSRIASRYGVRESQLVALNNLRSRHRIRAGQVLILPDSARGERVQVARAEPPADGFYKVRRGDSLWIIARRFGVSEAELVALNGLRNRHRIHVGQRLRLSGATVVAAASPTAGDTVADLAQREVTARETQATAAVAVEEAIAAEELAVIAEDEAGAAESAPAERPPVVLASREHAPLPAAAESLPAPAHGARPAPDPSDYAVHRGERITVQAEETLGHYAEWLEVRASQLRRLNRMRFNTPLVIGSEPRLDFSLVTPETFEQRRLAYHRTLQEEFFDAFVVTGTTDHTLRRGDTLWYLARRKFRLPVWLLVQYNPDLDFGALPTGVQMVVPRVEPRAS